MDWPDSFLKYFIFPELFNGIGHTKKMPFYKCQRRLMMNFMSYDFGLKFDEKLSDQEIKNRIDEFDVIIILERLVESLILLEKCFEHGFGGYYFGFIL